MNYFVGKEMGLIMKSIIERAGERERRNKKDHNSQIQNTPTRTSKEKRWGVTHGVNGPLCFSGDSRFTPRPCRRVKR